jgi:hypothetical protein
MTTRSCAAVAASGQAAAMRSSPGLPLSSDVGDLQSVADMKLDEQRCKAHGVNAIVLARGHDFLAFAHEHDQA